MKKLIFETKVLAMKVDFEHLSANELIMFRAVGRSENPDVPVSFGGHNLSPLVEIGLTDLPKYGGAMAPPAPLGTSGLML